MDETQNDSSLENGNLEGQVNDSLGMPESESGEAKEAEAHTEEKGDLPQGVKERLWRQERRHQKELRQVQEQLRHMHSKMGANHSESDNDQPLNPYTGQPFEAGSDEEKIHKAVAYALHHKDMEERKAKNAEKMAHVHQQYQEMEHDLDKASEKYDDFDEVVRAHDAPFTDTMRDTALLLPNRAEVLYKLGKNKPELKRIATLHEFDQARELVKLSHALINGEAKTSSTPRSLGNIKSTPVTNSHVTENTSVSDLRARMKAGFK